MRYIVVMVCALMGFASLASSQTNVDIEAQAKEIGHALRCVVCQNQSIEESDASLAQDMRRLVRVRLADGDSSDEVIAFMQERYGDYVLLKPPVQTNTYVLWFAPFALVLMALLWILKQSKSRVRTAVQPLSEAELAALKALRSREESA